MRLYLREMGVVPLLTREGEVAIAKRIERGLMKTHKSIARSPIAVMELLKVGEELREHRIKHSRGRSFSLSRRARARMTKPKSIANGRSTASRALTNFSRTR